MMARIGWGAAALLALYLLLQTAWTGWNLLRTKSLEPVAVGEKRLGSKGPEMSIFVTGDSASAGHGASSFDTSFTGRVARHFARQHRVRYRNTSVSGERMADLEHHPLPESTVDLILLSAGSNDLLHFTGPNDLERSARRVLERYAPRARRLVLIGPGLIHQAAADPLILQPFHRLRRPAYVEALTSACEAMGAVYVDPSGDTTKITAKEMAATVSDVDHFHLSDAGNAWWARRILEELGEVSAEAPTGAR